MKFSLVSVVAFAAAVIALPTVELTERTAAPVSQTAFAQACKADGGTVNCCTSSSTSTGSGGGLLGGLLGGGGIPIQCNPLISLIPILGTVVLCGAGGPCCQGASNTFQDQYSQTGLIDIGPIAPGALDNLCLPLGL